MITKDKVTEIFCIIDVFNRNLNSELENNLFLPTNNGKRPLQNSLFKVCSFHHIFVPL